MGLNLTERKQSSAPKRTGGCPRDLDADIADIVDLDLAGIRPAVEVHKDIHAIVDSHDSAFLCIPAGTPSIGKGATSAGANLARMWADRNFSAKHSPAAPAIMPLIRIIYILKG